VTAKAEGADRQWIAGIRETGRRVHSGSDRDGMRLHRDTVDGEHDTRAGPVDAIAVRRPDEAAWDLIHQLRAGGPRLGVQLVGHVVRAEDGPRPVVEVFRESGVLERLRRKRRGALE